MLLISKSARVLASHNRTVYSGRCEAGVVMASTVHLKS